VQTCLHHCGLQGSHAAKADHQCSFSIQYLQVRLKADRQLSLCLIRHLHIRLKGLPKQGAALHGFKTCSSSASGSTRHHAPPRGTALPRGMWACSKESPLAAAHMPAGSPDIRRVPHGPCSVCACELCLQQGNSSPATSSGVPTVVRLDGDNRQCYSAPPCMVRCSTVHPMYGSEGSLGPRRVHQYSL
jgi:hypothetical protein